MEFNSSIYKVYLIDSSLHRFCLVSRSSLNNISLGMFKIFYLHIYYVVITILDLGNIAQAEIICIPIRLYNVYSGNKWKHVRRLDIIIIIDGSSNCDMNHHVFF